MNNFASYKKKSNQQQPEHSLEFCSLSIAVPWSWSNWLTYKLTPTLHVNQVLGLNEMLLDFRSTLIPDPEAFQRAEIRTSFQCLGLQPS